MENIKKVLFGKALIVLLIILFVPSVGFSETRKTYYDSGELNVEFTYKNGKKEGPFKSYYKGGQLKAEGNYRKVKGRTC